MTLGYISMDYGGLNGISAQKIQCTEYSATIIQGMQIARASISWPEELVLSHLHIGHTRLTHFYLMNREDVPKCGACDLTIEHIQIAFAERVLFNSLFRI